MNVEDRIKKAKTSLIIMQPFFGVFASMLKYINKPDEWWFPNTPTMATDGDTIYYSDKFVDSITDKQLVGVFLHEIFHIIYMHCGRVRMSGRETQRWGVAIDLVVNTEIVDDIKTYELPPGGLYDKDFHGLTAEEAYDKLKDYPKLMSMFGFDLHMMLVVAPEEVKERILLSHSAITEKDRGNLPAEIQRLIKELKQAKVKWERLLHRYVGSVISKNDYDFSYPNRRFAADDIYLPSLRSPTIGDIVFACDTSGSMDEDQLKQILAEMAKLSYLINKITVMSCDAKVHEVVPTYTISDIINKVKFLGGGGTDFGPVFDKIAEMNMAPELLIFATDTMGGFPDKKPRYPVLWVSVLDKEKSSKIPFGQIIYME